LGESLRTQVAYDGLRKELLDEGGSPLAFLLYPHLWAFTVLGLGSLVLELGAPVALLSRRLGYGWICCVFGLHWGIYAIMGITFWYPMLGLAFLPFVVDDRLPDLATRWCADVEQRLRTPTPGRGTWRPGPAGPTAADR
jgi:hypothetical protein